MTLPLFTDSLSAPVPPPGLSDYLISLWYDGKGDWEQAHTVIQDIDDLTAAEIHAYLHRKEGDLFNADYWYRRAGKKRPALSLQEEWQYLVNALLC